MSEKSIDVAAGVLLDNQQRVLIAKRAADAHQGGKWEFPGGKRETGESMGDALVREFEEELGVTPLEFEPLITLTHQYPEKTVTLYVFRIKHYQGEAKGREGQAIEWCPVNMLRAEDFPPANRGIIQALHLPDRCLITPDASAYTRNEFLSHLEQVLKNGIRLIQLRSHSLDQHEYIDLTHAVKKVLTQRPGVKLILNMPPDWLNEVHADGLHLTAARLTNIKKRFKVPGDSLSAACHNVEQVQHAVALGVDFIFISPVQPTGTHPDAVPIGWDGFTELVRLANMPAFALGGLNTADIPAAKAAGAQGVAAVSAFWCR